MLRDTRVSAMEQRLSFLEGKVQEQTESLHAIRDAVVHLEERVDARFNAVDTKIGWLVGIQTTALIAQIAGLIAVVTALISSGGG
jgi:uncharacterized coiled-coil protein SlyX